jgi:hypothetical protein
MNLFHYCSAPTFFNIINSGTIWLSSLSSSNDTREGRWLSVILKTLCEARGIPPAETVELIHRFELLESINDCLGFCLSERGDVLSQWRGYADDGTGFSIGFKEEVFGWMAAANEDDGWPLRLQKVAYEEPDQLRLLGDRFELIDALIREGAVAPNYLTWDSEKGTLEEQRDAANRNSLRLSDELVRLTDLLYAIKNPAFREEFEWRFIREVDDRYPNLDFRSRGDRIVPYQKLKLPTDRASLLAYVYLGPRNPTPKEVVFQFLKRRGFRCQVFSSDTTYRR